MKQIDRSFMRFIFLSVLILSVSLFSFSTNYSAKFTYSTDFSQQQPNTSLSTEFYINGSSFGSNYDLSFALTGTSLNSSKLSFKFDPFALVVYKNQIYGTSGDQIILYRISDGQNGVSIHYAPLNVYMFNSVDLMYAQYDLDNGNVLIGKRGSDFDGAIDLSNTFGNFRLVTEFVWQNVNKFDFSDTVYLTAFSDVNSNWGIRYILTPSTTKYLSFSPQVLGNNNVINAWYKIPGKINLNSYVNTKFDFNNVADNLYDNTEVGVDLNYSDVSLNFKKTGLSDVTGVMPDEWGKFTIGTSYNFTMFGLNGKFAYSFGKPAHNTIATLGEVFYVELGKSFGNTSVFGKYQKIIGYYEERDTLYGEIKFAGFNNGQVTVSVGNTDFYNVNTFKPVLNIEFSLWW